VKRLKILILIFCAALSIPLGYFVLRTYWSLEQEEIAELRYFAVTLFDRIEDELAAFVLEEENRPVDQYRYEYVPTDQPSGSKKFKRSPLSRPPDEPYVLGYLQNNPDGSFQTPLTEAVEAAPSEITTLVSRLREANKIFNQKRTTLSDDVEGTPAEKLAKREKEEDSTFAEKYLNLSRSKEQRMYLGQRKARVEEITPGQASRLARRDQEQKSGQPTQESEMQAPTRSLSTLPPSTSRIFQVEVAPMQSVFINNRQVFIFRRIAINNQIYRQGFLLLVDEFMNHLVQEYFAEQPMARFTRLRLSVIDRGKETAVLQAGAGVEDSSFFLERIFPRPFGFLHATLACEQIPRSVGRSTLNVMMVVLASVILLGLFAIYHSARAVVSLSERRSRFVSSVTHELKTPLTNIRMYTEMLQQGIARDQNREEEYFRILGSESARLSRLVNNVLEFSKFEKKQTHLNMTEGILEEVIDKVNKVMREKLRQEGFSLNVETERVPPFKYDREAMIQILINLIDNSIKFGRSSHTRRVTIKVWPEPDAVKISVSDTGPGIPPHALKKVFEDFYRVDNEVTHTTGGTGIGLALVKKLVALMRGSVEAENNHGPGCTITISLPTINT